MRRDDVDFTDHAADQMAAGGLVVPDIIATVEHGEVIEEYPQALPLPACLSFYTIGGRPVHACWARSLITGKVIVITAYRPDEDLKQRWEPDFKTRRPR